MRRYVSAWRNCVGNEKQRKPRKASCSRIDRCVLTEMRTGHSKRSALSKDGADKLDPSAVRSRGLLASRINSARWQRRVLSTGRFRPASARVSATTKRVRTSGAGLTVSAHSGEKTGRLRGSPTPASWPEVSSVWAYFRSNPTSRWRRSPVLRGAASDTGGVSCPTSAAAHSGHCRRGLTPARSVWAVGHTFRRSEGKSEVSYLLRFHLLNATGDVWLNP